MSIEAPTSITDDPLAQVLTKLDRIDALLTEFEPILRAYLDPAASGPVAWAVRRQMGKKQ
jgi:hypothetical protein